MLIDNIFRTELLKNMKQYNNENVHGRMTYKAWL